MTDRELMQQALDWADNHGEVVFAGGGWNAVNLMNEWTRPLRARLAQPEPEPVAWAKPDDLISDGYSHAFTAWNPAPGTIDTVPLYTAPPRREWQGLTDEEKVIAYGMFEMMGAIGYTQAIEAKLKEKNARHQTL